MAHVRENMSENKPDSEMEDRTEDETKVSNAGSLCRSWIYASRRRLDGAATNTACQQQATVFSNVPAVVVTPGARVEPRARRASLWVWRPSSRVPAALSSGFLHRAAGEIFQIESVFQTTSIMAGDSWSGSLMRP